MVVSQGDVFWADFGEPIGSQPGLVRPVVVVQSDAFNLSEIATVVVVPLTSNLGVGRFPGNVSLSAKATGLPKESVANVSQITPRAASRTSWLTLSRKAHLQSWMGFRSFSEDERSTRGRCRTISLRTALRLHEVSITSSTLRRLLPAAPAKRNPRKMNCTFNRFHQPIGQSLAEWVPPSPPPREPMAGRFCRLEPLDPNLHAEPLHAANVSDFEGRSWTYLPYGPFERLETYKAWMISSCQSSDPLFFAICRTSDNTPVGVASYLRIAPESGSIEVGHIHFSEHIKRSRVATEAMFLMMKKVFELGYRRCEWKCDALNGPSRAAAQRLGFSYEGIFRQATVYKGRNRDTAWYAVIDAEWPALYRAFSQWLDPSNFDDDGQQRSRLSDLTRPVLEQRG